MNEITADEKTVKSDKDTFTSVELRLPGHNTVADLAEVLTPDLQECVSRIQVYGRDELYF